MTKRIGESGNIFFTLFGAVALVGVIGVATSNLMRGPVGTVMKLNQQAKAESQLQIARKMAALEAAQQSTSDCEPDTYLEPLPPNVTGACSTLISGGGCLPAVVGASKNDPWGTMIGYCAWDHGPTIGTCDPDLLGGTNASTQTVIAIVSAGPDRTFQTSCLDDPNYIQPANGGGDDIVMEWTYDDAIQGAGGLWALKSSDPDTAEILNGRNIEVGGTASFQSGASFARDVSLGLGSLLDLSAGSLLNLPDQTELGACNAANNEALRVDNSIGMILQICDDGVGWVDIGGSGSASSVAGGSGDVQFNSGGALYAVTNFNYDEATDRLRVGGGAAADDTLEVTGTADISGDLEADGLRVVTGGTAAGVGLSFNSAGTLGVYGSGTNVGLAVAGASRLVAHSTGANVIGNLDVTGDGDVTGSLGVGGKATITNDLDVTGVIDAQGTIIDTTGAVVVDDDLVVNQSLQVGTSFAAENFEIDTIGSGEGMYQYSSGAGDGLSLNTGGVTRMTIDGGGNTKFTGDVGIGLAGDPTTGLDIGGILRLRSDASAVAGAACLLDGSIAYTSGDELLICSNITSNWETIGTSGGGGGGGAGIWERNTGVIRLQPSYFNNADDFVVGSLQLDDEGSGNQDQRMFFENATGAFRAGVANGTQWDTRGNYSTAFGLNSQATAESTFAVGNNAQARATDGLALGRDVTVAAGALNSMGLGLGTASGVDPQITGIESFGIFMQDQSGVTLAANNTMGLFGGRLLIDPNEPATELVTSGSLTVDVEGNVGAINFCSEDGTFCFTAEDVSTGATGAPGLDREMIFNSAGALATDPNFVFTSAGRLGIGTAAPQAAFHVALPNGTTAAIIENTSNGLARLRMYNSEGGWQFQTDDDVFYIRSDTLTERPLRIENTGAIGIGLGGTSPYTKLDVRGTIKMSYGGEACDVNRQGAIHFDSIGEDFYVCQDGANWQRIITTGGGAGTPAGGGDREVQFNSGGNLEGNPNFVFTSAGRLGIGTAAPTTELTITDTDGDSVASIRLQPTGSDHADITLNRGTNSNYGRVRFQTTGTDSWALGMPDVDVPWTTTGQQFFIGRTSAVDPAFLIENGTYNVGIGSLLPQTLLDVNGTIKMSYGGEACDANRQGAIHFDSVGEDFYVCQDGANWQRIITTGGGAGTPAGGGDREIQFNSGGNLEGLSTFVLTSAGYFGFGTTSPQTDFEITGGLRLSGGAGAVDGFVTPLGATIYSHLTIPAYAPAAYEQMFVTGLTAGSDVNARAITLLDARAGAHQPTISVLSPNEVGAVGLSWDGSNTTAYLKSTNGDIGIRSGTTDIANFGANGLVTFTSSGAVLLPVGDTSQQPTAAQNGMIRYNTDNGMFEAFQAGSWQDILTGAAATSLAGLTDTNISSLLDGQFIRYDSAASEWVNVTVSVSDLAGNAGLDREIFFNSGGALGTDTNFVFTSSGLFGIGTAAPIYDLHVENNYNGAAYNAVVNYDAGAGASSNIVAGADGGYTALVQSSVAGGDVGILYNNTTAGLIVASENATSSNLAFQTGAAATDRMVIDHNGLVTFTSSGAVLLPVGDTSSQPSTPQNGMIRYNTDNGMFEAFQAGSWQDILTGAAATSLAGLTDTNISSLLDGQFIRYDSAAGDWVNVTVSVSDLAGNAGNDREIFFNSGGTLGTDTNFVLTSAGRLGLGTAAPSQKLTVTDGNIFVNHTTGAAGLLAWGQGNGSQYSYLQLGDNVGGNSWGIRHEEGGADNNALDFSFNTVERMTLTSAGLLGIGTAAPTHNLHVDRNADSAVSGAVTNMNAGANARAQLRVVTDGGQTLLSQRSVAGGDLATLYNTNAGGLYIVSENATNSLLAFQTGAAAANRMTIDHNGLVTFTSSGAVLLPVGNTGQQPSAAQNGMIRYNTDNGMFEAFQAGSWQDILTGAAATSLAGLTDTNISGLLDGQFIRYDSAAGNWVNVTVSVSDLAGNAGLDREIFFNSGGALGTDTNFVFTSAGQVGIGTANPLTTIHISDSNPEILLDMTVPGDAAIGFSALGTVYAGMEWNSTNNDLVLAIDTTNAGIGDFGITTGGDLALAVANNGDVSIGAIVAQTKLDVDGTLKIMSGGEACDANREGAIRYDSGANVFEFCALTANDWETVSLGSGTLAALSDTNITAPTDGQLLYYSGTSWINYDLLASDVAAPGLDTEIVFNSGGALATNAAFIFDSTQNGLGIGAPPRFDWNLDVTDPTSNVAVVFEGNGAGNTNAAYFALGNSAAGKGDWEFSHRGDAIANQEDSLLLAYGGSVRMALTSAGSMGVGITIPQTRLDANGTLKIASGGEACDANREGALRYDSGANIFEFCALTANDWETVSLGAGTLAALSDTNIAGPSNGQILYFSGSDWINYTYGIDDLSDGKSDGTSIFLGNSSGLVDDGTTNHNIGLGVGTLQNVTASPNNIAIGQNALNALQTGQGANVAIGLNALSKIQTDIYATAVGSNALKESTVPGDAFGYNALAANTIGQYNAAFGNSALRANTTGSENAAFGRLAMGASKTGGANSAFGSGALRYLSSGGNNVSVGRNSLLNIVYGSNNVAIGAGAGEGAYTLSDTVSNSVFLGRSAGASVRDGSTNNIFLGFSTGSTATTGSSNLLLGYDIETPTPTTSNYINIGGMFYGSAGTGELYIGGAGAVRLPVGADATRPGDLAGTAAVNGMIRYNTTSGKFEGYQAGAWQDILTGAIAGGAAAPDRGIQFNSGNSFAADANFIYTSAGRLGLGTATPDRQFHLVGSTANGDILASIENTNLDGEFLNMINGNGVPVMRFLQSATGQPRLLVNDNAYEKFIDLQLTAQDSILYIDNNSTTAGDNDAILSMDATSTGETEIKFLFDGVEHWEIESGDSTSYDFVITNASDVATLRLQSAGNMGVGVLAPNTRLDVDGTIKMAYGGETCNVNTEGAIHYDSSDNNFYVCQTAGSWSLLATGSPNAAAPDRGIQFNSGNSFAAAANLTYTSQGALIVGSPDQSTAGYKFVYDDVKGAFTVGAGNNALNGTLGVSMGDGGLASGYSSFALGQGSQATQDLAVAMGSFGKATAYAAVALGGTGNTASGSYAIAGGGNSTASGQASLAVGTYSSAGGNSSVALGSRAEALGDYSFAFGLGFPLSTSPKVTGNESFGIFMGDHSNVQFSSANTFGLFGGKMVIDPRVPATNLVADTAFEVEGTIKMAYGNEACDVAREGAIHYDSSDNNFYVCQTAGSWSVLATGSPNAAAPDRGIQFNSGNSFAAVANLTYTTDGDFVVGSYQIEDTTTGSQDSRMFFDVSNSAFRAGSTSGAQWNYVSSGQYSVAFGNNSIASGNNSFATSGKASGQHSVSMAEASSSVGRGSIAMGRNAIAGGNYSTSLGYGAVTTLSNSVAIGSFAKASGQYSTAIGNYTSAGDYGLALGREVSALGSYSMAIGLGNPADAQRPQVTASNALGVFLGAQDNVTLATPNTIGMFGGKMVIDPRVPATNLVADTAFEVEGTIKMAYGGETCNVNTEGALRYDSGANIFEFCALTANDWETVSLGGGTLAALTDTDITAPADGQVLYYSGSDWVNNRLAINDLSDAVTAYSSSSMYLGQGAGAAITTAIDNTILGRNAGGSLTTGGYNLAIGVHALGATVDGGNNLAIGNWALGLNVNGYRNIAIGEGAMNSSNAVNVENTVIGWSAYSNATGGSYNTVLGDSAMSASTGANYSVALGGRTLQNAIGDRNIAIGFQAGDLTTSGADNIIIGYDIDAPTAATSNYLNLGNIFYGSMGTGELYIGSNGALRMPVGVDATRPGTLAGTTAANGMLRYNSASDRFEGYQGGSWQDIVTGAAGGSAAAPDRGIQFNSGNSFAAVANFTYTSVGNFGVGLSAPDEQLTVADNAKVLGHMSIGADSSVDVYKTAPLSVVENATSNDALGIYNYSNGTAGGSIRGIYNLVEADNNANNYSRVIGGYTEVENYNSGTVTTLAGQQIYVEHGGSGNVTRVYGLDVDVTAAGSGNVTNSMYGINVRSGNNGSFTQIPNNYGIYINTPYNDNSIVTNNFGLYIDEQSGEATTSYALYSNGGEIYFKDNVGIGVQYSSAKLDVDGTLKIAYGGEACDAAREGGIHYNSSDDNFYVCQTAGSWTVLATGSPNAAAPDRGIQFNSGGSFAAASTLQYTSMGALNIGTFASASVLDEQNFGINKHAMRIVGQDSPTAPSDLMLSTYTNSATTKSDLDFFKARGSEAVPADVQVGDAIGLMRWYGFRNGNYRDGGAIAGVVSNLGGSIIQTDISLRAGGTGSDNEVMRVSRLDRVGVMTSTPQLTLDVYGAIKFSSSNGTACDAAREGAMQYGSGGSKIFEVCADTANGWEQLALGGTVSGALNDLSDVNTTGFADGNVLLYSAGASAWVPGSAPLVGAFTDLTDTPASYVGQGGRFAVVNSGETAIAFTDTVIESVSGAAAPGTLDLSDLGDVSASPTGGQYLTYDSASGVWIAGSISGESVTAAGSDRQLQFNSGGTFGADANLVFTSTGRLGIGTSSPSHDLVVYRSAGTSDPTIRMQYDGVDQNTAGRLEFGRSSGASNRLLGSIGFGADTFESSIEGWFDPASSTASELRFSTNAVGAGPGTREVMILKESGYLGLGTSNPIAELDVVGAIKFSSSSLACNSATHEGAMQFGSGGSNIFEVCADSANGWEQLALGGTVSGGLDDLSDVDVATVTGGQFLSYDSASGDWVNVDSPSLWTDSGAGYIEYNSTLGGVKIASITGAAAPSGATKSVVLSASDISAAGADTQIQFNSGGDFAANANFVFTGAGRLGLGTASPVSVFDVAGDIKFASSSLACNSATHEGAMQFGSGGSNIFEVCANSGTGWEQLALGGVVSGGFTDLSDTPASYVGQAGKFAVVNSGETAISFTDTTIESVSGEPLPNTIDLNDLGDVSVGGALDAQFLTYDSVSGNWVAGDISSSSVSAAGGDTEIQYNSNGSFDSDTTFVYDAGRLGVGTASPTVEVDVTGDIKLSGNLQLGRFAGNAPTYISAGYFALNNLTDVNTTGFVDGNVLLYSAGASGWVPGGVAASSLAAAGTDTQLQFNSGGAFGASSSLVFNYGSGFLGVGTASPTVEVDVVGDVRISNNLILSPVSGLAAPVYISAGFFPLASLTDVDVTGVADGNVLLYSAGASGWVVGSGGGGGGAINDLSDATTDYVTGFNFSMGSGAGVSLASGGQYNLAIGQGALPAVTTGDANMAIGRNTLTALTNSSGTVAIGNNAGREYTMTEFATGSVFIGNNAGEQTGYWSNASIVAIGSNALALSGGFQPIDGSTVIGTAAMENSGQNGPAQNNTAIGNGAGLYQREGNDNVYIGAGAASGGAPSYNQSGDNNVFIGMDSATNLDGVNNNNIFLGQGTGLTLNAGDSNLLIGTGVDVPYSSASNYMSIADVIYASGIYNATTHVGINNATPNVELDVTGDIEYTGTLTDVSDRRLKTDITPLNTDEMMAKLAQVNTYSFRMKDDPKGVIEFGVMAQELEKQFPELVKTANDEMGTKSVNYVGLIAPLIEASKELKSENDNLRAELAEMKTAQAEFEADIMQQVNGLKAHTGYGIGKAQMGLWMLVIMFGSLSLWFVIGGIVRNRQNKQI